MRKILLLLVFLLLPSVTLSHDNELFCLTQNVYYEARGESRAGKIAVALVTLNRMEDKRYPSTICGVVFQKKQFSWTVSYNKGGINMAQWRQSQEAALEAYLDRSILGNFKATHFHNTQVNPGWKLRRVTKINNHIFYM